MRNAITETGTKPKPTGPPLLFDEIKGITGQEKEKLP
jgi:hypothetical protein